MDKRDKLSRITGRHQHPTSLRVEPPPNGQQCTFKTKHKDCDQINRSHHALFGAIDCTARACIYCVADVTRHKACNNDVLDDDRFVDGKSTKLFIGINVARPPNNLRPLPHPARQVPVSPSAEFSLASQSSR